MAREPRSLLSLLEELRQDFDRVREAQKQLERDMKEFGRTLGLLGIEATDAAVRSDGDAA
jgi:hypothetical protein